MTNRISAVITIAAARPCAGSVKVRPMKSEAMVRVAFASCHGIIPRITVLITT